MIVINGSSDREKACAWARGVPVGTRIEFKETRRSLPQNARFWAMLTDVAVYMRKRGRDHTPEQWRTIFMAAYGHEVKFLPTLDQKSFIPLGHSSSDLSVKEMTDLIEFILAWGAENGVTFKAQNSDDTPPPSSSDEAGNSSQAPADQDGDGDSSSSSLPSEGEPEPISADERSMLIRFAKDVLHKAADPKISGETLMKVEKTWAADIAGLSDQAKTKAKAISGSMRAIVKGDADLDAAVSYFEEVLDCPGQIGGNGNG